MNKTLSTCLLSFAMLAPLAASAAESVARFEDGIGAQPLKLDGTPNTVVGVLPGGVPWVISRLSADVRADGQIRVDGRGLLFAGTDNIGTPGRPNPVTVRARLFCSAVAAGDSEPVQLDARGDFRIHSALTLNNVNQIPPSPCTNPVLLIVNNGNGAWFAAGIPKE